MTDLVRKSEGCDAVWINPAKCEVKIYINSKVLDALGNNRRPESFVVGMAGIRVAYNPSEEYPIDSLDTIENSPEGYTQILEHIDWLIENSRQSEMNAAAAISSSEKF